MNFKKRELNARDVPLVAIILPVHGSRVSVTECINSVIVQSYDSWKLIVCAYKVSEGVENQLQSIAKQDSRISIIYMQEPGIPAALNAGLLASSFAKYVARIDSDDLMLPKRLEKQVKYLEDNPQVVVVGGQRMLISENNKILFNKTWYPLTNYWITHHLRSESPFAHPATTIRRAELVEVGGYRQEFRHSEDIDLWFRLLEVGKGHNLRKKMIAYRTSSPQNIKEFGDEKLNPWKYIPKIAHLKRSVGIDEDLQALTLDSGLWFRNSLKLLYNNSKLKPSDRCYVQHLNSIFQNVGFEGSRSRFRFIFFFKDKVMWRLTYPFLLLSHIHDKRVYAKLRQFTNQFHVL